MTLRLPRHTLRPPVLTRISPYLPKPTLFATFLCQPALTPCFCCFHLLHFFMTLLSILFLSISLPVCSYFQTKHVANPSHSPLASYQFLRHYPQPFSLATSFTLSSYVSAAIRPACSSLDHPRALQIMFSCRCRISAA